MIATGTIIPAQVTKPNPGRTFPNPQSSDSWDNQSRDSVAQSRIVTLFTPAPALEPMAFLKQAAGSERFYWSEPSGENTSLTIAGMGVAAEILAPPIMPESDTHHLNQAPSRYTTIAQQAQQLLAGSIIKPAFSTEPTSETVQDPYQYLMRPRLFGGFAFQEDFTPDNTWSVFYPAHFILPHYQLLLFGGVKYLAINAVIAPDEDLESSIIALEEALKARLLSHFVTGTKQSFPIGPVWRFPMTPAMWGNLVDDATTAIRDGQFEKVVLARVCEVRFGEPIDAATALEFLDNEYPDCFRFLFEPVPDHAFFGATPELLIRKQGESFESMALAGSAARGKTEIEDQQRAGELLASAKDRFEHQLVVDGIKERLLGLVEFVHADGDPHVLKLRNIQHLHTPIHGQLWCGKTADILQLLERLHPTPALGGSPYQESLNYLRQAERIPRGWYAAPIGWLDDQLDGVFAVGIRSAVTQHERAWLYAGAGIVADSKAEREWDETRLKFKPMLEALGVTDDA